MLTVPLPRPSQSTESHAGEQFYAGGPAAGSASFPASAVGTVVSKKDQDWKHMVAAGTVVAGGVLMVTGHKRAGLAVAAVGTMVALLDEPEVMDGWWKSMPNYLKGAQELLDKVEGYLDEASKQGKRLQTILHR